MLLRSTIWLWIATLILVAGCRNGAGDGGETVQYRTVSVQPQRDTEAADRHNRLGLELLAAGELDKAREAFERALTANVEYGPAHNNLGKVYFQQGDYYRAAWEFEYARKLLPRHPEPRNNLGLVLEEGGELDRAVDEYRGAIALGGDRIEYRANLARALIRRGDRTDEVRSLLAELVRRHPDPEWRAWARRQQMLVGQSAP